MKKNIFQLLVTLLGTVAIVFNSYAQSSTSDKGVVINGIKWATRNVDKPGTFAASPEDAGMLYQWNRKKAWPVTGDITDWDATVSEGDIWTKANDPSPAGWRVPTLDEIETLLDTDKVSNEWTIQNDIYGRKFTDKTSGNFIFLPAVGSRYDNGMLGNVTSYYWSSSQTDNSYACYLYFNSGDIEWSTFYDYGRSCGFSVRPVAD